jgi:predicted lipoprotein with Yx(FWY)xxD motif
MMKVDRREARAHARAFVALMGAALLAAGCGSSSADMSSAPGGSEASPSGSSPSSRGVVIGTARGPVGAYLTGADGQALYLWERDSNRESNCSGECATQWPPLITKTTGIPSGGVTAAGLGTIIRSDGSKQVTYMGHPLYYFAADSGVGAPSGEGIDSFGARWWLVAPSGAAITSAIPPPSGY